MGTSNPYEVRVEITDSGAGDPTAVVGGYTQSDMLVQPSSYAVAGLNSQYFDSHGFIIDGPATFYNLEFDSIFNPSSPASIGTSDSLTDRLAAGSVGIFVEAIPASSQYDWQLADNLGTFKLYSPLQDFSAAYPQLITREIGTYYSELGIAYNSTELTALANKFGTLPYGESALTRVISRTKELAGLIASTRRKKLAFSKANNNYKLTTQDLYSIRTSENVQNTLTNLSATTGSNTQPAESAASGRVSYDSYT